MALQACSDDETALLATDAWVTVPTLHTTSVGGLTLHNRSGEACILQQVDAADFSQTEILPGTTFEAKIPMTLEDEESLVLAPPAMHLRLSEPKRPLRAGERTLLTLRFADGRMLLVDALVRRSPPAPSQTES